MSRSIPSEAWFVAAGLALVPLVRVRGSSAPVHAGLLLACAALLVLGAWVKRFLLRLEEQTPAPAHAIVLGQAALLVYFYARSAASRLGLPGVCGPELYLVAIAAFLHLWLRRRPPRRDAKGYAIVWLAFWASTLTYLGYRSGRLDTPSSDPDLHALWARLTAGHGALIYDLLPQSADRVTYPSAFSALNALFVDLSRRSAVEVVNCQVALQACLMVALLLEMVFALRRGPAPGIALPLLGLAHAVFAFPVNAAAPHLEGTARLAHTALALLPLTFAVRLRAAGSRAAPALIAAGFCLAFSVVINPALLLVEALLVLGALPFVRIDARSALTALALSAAFAALLWLSDAWLGPLLAGADRPRGAALPSLRWLDGLGAGLGAAGTSLACKPGPHCPSLARELSRFLLLPLALGAGAVLLAGRRSARLSALGEPARVVVALAAALWLALFAGPFFDALLSEADRPPGALLRQYAWSGFAVASTALLFALLGAALSFATEAFGGRRCELVAPALLAVACAAATALDPSIPRRLEEAWAHDVRGAPGSAAGPLFPEDVRVAKAAAALVAPGEKILLPGLVQRMNQSEEWFFALGGARAIALHSDAPFAFFHSGTPGANPGGPAPWLYRAHVCDRLDLPWLASQGIVWVYESAQVQGEVCLPGWKEARAESFELKLRDGAAALWRLRSKAR